VRSPAILLPILLAELSLPNPLIFLFILLAEYVWAKPPLPGKGLFMILLYSATAKKSLEFRFARKFLIVLAIRLLWGCL